MLPYTFRMESIDHTNAMTTRSVLTGLILGGCLLASLLAGCTTTKQAPASATSNNAFTAYWPPAEKSGALRLAVKDLIDMKGVVTSAGSEFLAKNSPPPNATPPAWRARAGRRANRREDKHHRAGRRGLRPQ
jgi:hypothetical protein